MAKLTEEALKKSIRDGVAAPVYCLYGEEQYLIRHYVRQIADTVVGEALPAFNLAVLKGETLTFRELTEAWDALPMMHDRRCLLIEDFSPTSLSAEELQELIQMIADPNPAAVAVFYYTTVTPGREEKWKKFLAAVEDADGLAVLNKRTPEDLVRLLCKGAGQRECRMTTTAAGYLVECVGNDLNTLFCELEKLCAYKPGQEITTADIDLLCCKTLNATAFQMVKEIIRNRPEQALTLLSRLFAAREQPLMILGALASSYTNMYLASVAEECHLKPEVLGKEAGLKNPKNLGYSANDARRLGRRRLVKSIGIIETCDHAMKSSSADERILLEQTVVALLQTAKERP